jgi:hypothetical protein
MRFSLLLPTLAFVVAFSWVQSQGTGFNYTLTDEKTSVKTTATAADVEKHSSNDKVKLTGMNTTDARATRSSGSAHSARFRILQSTVKIATAAGCSR